MIGLMKEKTFKKLAFGCHLILIVLSIGDCAFTYVTHQSLDPKMIGAGQYQTATEAMKVRCGVEIGSALYGILNLAVRVCDPYWMAPGGLVDILSLIAWIGVPLVLLPSATIGAIHFGIVLILLFVGVSVRSTTDIEFDRAQEPLH